MNQVNRKDAERLRLISAIVVNVPSL